MKDISARELKGHNILAVERFKDSTRWMIEFVVLHPCSAYGSRGDEMRLFLAEDSYQNALQDHQRRKIKIKRYARVVEGHILDFKPGKKCKPGTVISFGDGILTGEVIDVVEEGNRLIKFTYEGIFEEVISGVTERIDFYMQHRVHGKIKTAALMFSNVYGILGKTAAADELIKLHLKDKQEG